MPKRNQTLRNTVTTVGALLILFCSLFAWGVGQQPKRVGKYAYTIRNYGVVWPGRMMRSGKPNSEAGWTWLREQGVRSIVSFVKGDKVDYKKFGFENVLQIPLHG